MLVLLTADVIKNKDKNNTLLALSEQEEIITNDPNIPVLSAGMIPVKYEGDNLIITKNDSSWYNYAQGTPAYMMLNDGVYQSELVVDMTGKKLASETIGQVVEKEEQGSIYMWIPRYAINAETEEIKYVNQEVQLGEKWTVPDMFLYAVADETKPDYSLAGIWIEKTPLVNISAVNTKITNMNKEENIYGLIANTVGTRDTTCPWLLYAKEMLSVGVDAHIDPLPDPSNSKRTILKIIDTNKVEPIKVKAKYNGEIGQIEIQVTYNKNGIARIIDEEGNILSKNSLIATTGDKTLEFGKTYTYTIIDNKGNKKQVNCITAIPILARDITAKYYGKVVTNYTCTNTGVSTWRIFHSDGNNIYLIADDYVPYDNLPKSIGEKALNKGSTSYPKSACFTNILDDYTGSAWIKANTNPNALKWLTWVNSHSSGTDNNIKAVAYMMDTESWSSFAGEKAEYAIGGPTLELFCASYKVRYPSGYAQCQAYSSGYKVKWSSSSSYGNYMSGLAVDNFYIKSDSTKARAMWLASPSNYNSDSLMCTGYSNGMLTFRDYNDTDLGFRPIVCLKSSVKLLDYGDGTYSLQ